jgi:hypothetical protein
MTTTVTLLVPPDRVPALRQSVGDDELASRRLKDGRVRAIPETAVIETGSQSIVYRETLPGTFEGVLVSLGPKMTGPNNVTYRPVISGLEIGDAIATAGSFLVDAETRLNPAAGSIYFGGSGSKSAGNTFSTVRPTTPEDEDAKLLAALRKLSPEDRTLADQQRVCPILEGSRLGSMGIPLKVIIDGKPVFVCCPACEGSARAKPQETLQKVEKLKSRPAAPPSTPARSTPQAKKDDAEGKIQAFLAKLNPTDRKLAEQQRECVVLTNSRLGSMGVPHKVIVDGHTVFVCCLGCEKSALVKPQETLKRLEELKRKSSDASHAHKPESSP